MLYFITYYSVGLVSLGQDGTYTIASGEIIQNEIVSDTQIIVPGETINYDHHGSFYSAVYEGYYTYNGDKFAVLYAGSDGIYFAPGTPFDAGSFVTTLDTTDPFVLCFAAGTYIATEGGEKLVEDLEVGSLVITASGAACPVKWIGKRIVDCYRHATPAKVLPVRIAVHAFGYGLPARDLYLSPDHTVYVESVLIPVKYLINGSTVCQAPVGTITYFHVELDEHSVILANGLPCESYLESGRRLAFDNGRIATLHPEFEPHPDNLIIWDTLGYAPLVVTGEVVERVRAVLAKQAASLGRSSATAYPLPSAA